MEGSQGNYFEISDSVNFVRLEPIQFINYDSNMDWDKDWVKTKITVKGGSFSGEYVAEFMTIDFEKFKQELTTLYDNLSGYANFYDLEGYLELKIKGDGIGHFEIDIKACDKPGIYGSQLTFEMSFDQTFIKKLVNQLNNITSEFPIIGNL